MRKIIMLCATVLCFAGAAAAQNDTTATLVAEPAPAAASKMSSNSGYPWQVGANFTYQRFDIGGGSSNMYGLQSTVTRWLGDSSFGLEGSVSTTFGRLNPTNREQVVFYGGGVHVGKRTGTWQPWVHGLFGGAHDRFNQHIGQSSFNGFGFMAGGGVDIQWRSHIAWRVQGDYLGTRLTAPAFGLNGWQKTVSAGVGILFDF
jgi:hypothetical protein